MAGWSCEDNVECSAVDSPTSGAYRNVVWPCRGYVLFFKTNTALSTWFHLSNLVCGPQIQPNVSNVLPKSAQLPAARPRTTPNPAISSSMQADRRAMRSSEGSPVLLTPPLPSLPLPSRLSQSLPHSQPCCRMCMWAINSISQAAEWDL